MEGFEIYMPWRQQRDWRSGDPDHVMWGVGGKDGVVEDMMRLC